MDTTRLFFPSFFFSHVLKLSQEDEAAVARRIASCWYYTATEVRSAYWDACLLRLKCNFDESDENPENDNVEPIAPQQLLGMLFAQAPPAAAGGDDDGDDDDEGEEVRLAHLMSLILVFI